MHHVIGTCSICGGEVRGYQGAWMSVLPPPPPTCAQCGAQAAHGPVIPMVPAPTFTPLVTKSGTAGKEWW